MTTATGPQGPNDGWLNGRVLVWALYDVASSTYVVLMPAILFPVYFRSHLVAGGTMADTWWGLTAAAALLLAGATAPSIGAFADGRRLRTRCLAVTTLVCCSTTAVLGAVANIPALAASALFILGQAAAVVSQSLYDSYVGDVAAPGQYGRVSGFGWGVGFLGGVLATLLVLAAVDGPLEARLAEACRTAFLVIAALYAILAVPALVGLSRIDRDRHRAVADRPALRQRGWTTVRQWREHREAFKVLLAVFLINDALVTIGFFVGPYFTSTLGLTLSGLLKLVLLYHLIAAPATYLFGRMSDRWEIRRAIMTSLAVWAAASVILAAGRGTIVAVVVIGLFALGFGSTQALCRALLARAVPDGRSAEFFGFGAVAGRLSAATGPVIFGAISSSTGSQRLALLSPLLFLALGAAVLSRVAVRPTPAEASRFA